ncbi:diguanylate cyclase [Vibrio ichthyoenteri ATCC 700023]|uniref:diguanylate cyclase n=1 Tax=Vibrio ichthyoenteri ATCC 700023 TaxID=870968 RepID=F9RYH2_9VIBR|nr:diguanylate cyclase [Vibrio ichthyoenteri]EGU46389.1 diguanylate cyclase [Vibrio ichthyoenteri ATCC 700023]
MEPDIFNPSLHIRRAVLFWLSLFLTIASTIMAILSINLAQSLFMPAYEGLFALFSAYICYKTYRNNCRQYVVDIYAYSLILMIAIGVSVHSIRHGMLIWASLFPLMFYLLLGTQKGTVATSIGMITLVTATAYKMLQHQNAIHPYLLANFVLCYLCIWVVSYIIQVKRSHSDTSLGQLASRDSLTGVYNRHALVHHFSRFRQQSQPMPMSLLILDLDYFKQVNDKHGHDVGDKVLIQAAAVIDAHSDEHSVYRIGGEEFCVALRNTSNGEAMARAELIRKSIEECPFFSEENPIKLTASIGVYQCDPLNSLDKVLHIADMELYRAKKNGRNQVMAYQENEQAIC